MAGPRWSWARGGKASWSSSFPRPDWEDNVLIVAKDIWRALRCHSTGDFVDAAYVLLVREQVCCEVIDDDGLLEAPGSTRYALKSQRSRRWLSDTSPRTRFG